MTNLDLIRYFSSLTKVRRSSRDKFTRPLYFRISRHLAQSLHVAFNIVFLSLTRSSKRRRTLQTRTVIDTQLLRWCLFFRYFGINNRETLRAPCTALKIEACKASLCWDVCQIFKQHENIKSQYLKFGTLPCVMGLGLASWSGFLMAFCH